MQELFQQFPVTPRQQKGNQWPHVLCPQEPALLLTPAQAWNKLLLRKVGRDTDTGAFQSLCPGFAQPLLCRICARALGP